MRAVPVITLIPTAARATTDPVKRHRMPGSDQPVAMAVEVPAGTALIHLSSAAPPLRPEGGFGDTRTQAAGVFGAIQAMLHRLGLGLGDVIRLQAYLVGDPSLGGRMDLAGFTAAYRDAFGTARQPNLPARTVVQVAGLADPGWLIEIEATAARNRH
jgi:enamine deaminase RidA (YjgF/YER057c/UK114 family)